LKTTPFIIFTQLYAYIEQIIVNLNTDKPKIRNVNKY